MSSSSESESTDSSMIIDPTISDDELQVFPPRQLNEECLRAIFSQLNRSDQLNCSLVSKSCLQIIRQIISVGHLTVDYKLTRKLSDAIKKKAKQNSDTQPLGPKDLQQLIGTYYPHATRITIDYGVKVNSKYFHAAFFLRKTLKHLIICASSSWSDCRCHSVAGKFPNISYDDLHGSLDKLDTIEVASTVKISSCCLLDLICRAPQLRVIKFHGSLNSLDHWKSFLERPFPGNLKTLQWPWIKNEDTSKVIELIIDKNIDLENIDCTSIVICSMLSQQRLRNLKRLVIRLSEVWRATARNTDHITNIKYLDLAKKIISLEIRSYDFEEKVDLQGFPQHEIDRFNLEKEKYVRNFWDTIDKISSIKAITIYGSWDFNSSCREVSKHAKNVEFLKINLLPEDIREIKVDREAFRELNIEDGLTALRRLPNLKSLHIICSEKLNEISSMSCDALTKLADKLWILDVKVCLSMNVKELIFNIQRRGNPLNKTYKLTLDVLPKTTGFCEIIMNTSIGAEGTRYKSIEDLDANLHKLAQIEAQQRQPGSATPNVAVWGLSLAPSFKCKQYNHLKSDWDYYFEHFSYDPHLQM